MDFAKAILIRSQADIDVILEQDPDHWIGEAMENGYRADELEDHAIFVFEKEDGFVGEVACESSSKLFKDRTVRVVTEVSLPCYAAGSMSTDCAKVAAFYFDGDESGIVWIPCTDNLSDEGLL